MYTSKQYMSTVTAVDPHWLADLGGTLLPVFVCFIPDFLRSYLLLCQRTELWRQAAETL